MPAHQLKIYIIGRAMLYANTRMYAQARSSRRGLAYREQRTTWMPDNLAQPPQLLAEATEAYSLSPL